MTYTDLIYLSLNKKYFKYFKIMKNLEKMKKKNAIFLCLFFLCLSYKIIL